MNNFTAAGGDEYTMFASGKLVAQLGNLEDILIDYMAKNGTKGCEVSGRITTVTGKAATPSVSITSKVTTLKVNKSYTFKASVKNVVGGKVTWSVSNSKVATINKTSGKLTAKKAGTVTVTATCGSYKKSVKVKVTK
jgi:uncharacterized protein YjdB